MARARRLTPEQVTTIKWLYKTDFKTYSSNVLAKEFNVSGTTILKVLNGKYYPNPPKSGN